MNKPQLKTPQPDPYQCVGVLLQWVSFARDSAALTSQASLALNAVAGTLTSSADLVIDVGAHTDAMGSISDNKVLSEMRAQSVVNYLTTLGIDRNRLLSNAYGESSPFDTNDTAKGRRRNRRVEMRVR